MKRFLSILLTLALMAALLVIPASAEENGMPSYDEVIVSSGEEWTVEENCIIGHLEIEDGGIVRSDHPVIVFYEESATVENGQVVGEVQFVSDYDEVVAIVHTNDVHGYIDVEPYSPADFEQGAESLTLFFHLRAQSVHGQLNGMIPSTAEGQEADSSNLIDTSAFPASEERKGGASGESSGEPVGASSGPSGESDSASGEANVQ